MKSPFMAGIAAKVSALTDEDRARMHDAGLTWLRFELKGFDHACFLHGEIQPNEFYQMRDQIIQLRKDGFEIMGITPSAKDFSAEAGVPGTPAYFDNYRRVCAHLAREFDGLIDYWQVANELDIWIFREPLSLEQSAEFLKAGLRGIKDAGKHLKTGINVTLFPSLPGEVDGNTDRHEGIFIARSIYQDPGLEVDYAGFDSYPGTWREGGAESWRDYLTAFHELVQKPIIIQEFGYSSIGDMMSESEKASHAYPCQVKKWRFAWHGAHTPRVQADFITESYRTFAELPYVIGATYYCWRDHETCWQCGSPDCPAETGWGLIDRQNNLKPSYDALKASIAAFNRA